MDSIDQLSSSQTKRPRFSAGKGLHCYLSTANVGLTLRLSEDHGATALMTYVYREYVVPATGAQDTLRICISDGGVSLGGKLMQCALCIPTVVGTFVGDLLCVFPRRAM